MPVVIWRRVEVPSVDKTDVLSSPGNTAAYEAEVKAALAVNLPPITAWLDARGRKYEVDAGSPVLTAHLTADEVLELGRLHHAVAWIDYHRPVVPASTAWWGDTGIPMARTMVNGASIPVCVVESSHPQMCGASCEPSGSPPFIPCNENLRLGAVKCGSSSGDNHVENVSNIISSLYPSLPGVTNAPVKISDFNTFHGRDENDNFVWHPTEWGLSLFNAWSWCRSKGALAINYSMSFPDPNKFQGPVSATWPPPDGDYTASDQVVDWQVMQPPYPLIAMSAGNEGHIANGEWVKNKAHNAIIVGALDDKATGGNVADDVVWLDPSSGGSSWKNPHGYSNTGDHELPHIVAPGKCIDTGGRTCCPTCSPPRPLTGTSYATPQVVGAAALMMERAPSLQGWPEVIKGILMVTATRHVPPDGPLPFNGVGSASDRRGGIGALDTGLAVTFANMPVVAVNQPALFYARASLPITGNTGATGPFGPYNIRNHNRRVRVVLTWNTWVGGCSNSSQFCDFDVPPDIDLDVKDKATHARVCNSSSFDSTWEACEFNAIAGQGVPGLDLCAFGQGVRTHQREPCLVRRWPPGATAARCCSGVFG